MVTWRKHDSDFCDFLWVFRRLSIKIRIELQFFGLHLEMKRQWSLRASQDLHVTSDPSFPNANNIGELQSINIDII